jgi:anti-sigma regulatory factor (Ser/Thr protein kinase)
MLQEPPVEARHSVPNGPTAPAQARRLIDSLAPRIPESVLEDVRLAVSELVTNSYKYAGNPPGHPIGVTLDLTEERLRVEIIDRSIFDPTPETPDEQRSGKMGLAIVNRLADDWGRVSEGGIWAEFRIPSKGPGP